MKPEEAILRIKEHIAVHQYKEPHAVYITEAFEMAIDALEKQMPKKPVEGYVFSEAFREYLIKKGQNDMAGSKGSCCPSCGEHIGESEQILKKKNYMPFCKWCGQALKQPEGET